MNRTEFLREQTITNKNKIARTVMPKDWSTANLNCGLCERKALALKMMLERMPLFIGEKELVVGTRTLYAKTKEEKDEYTISDFDIFSYPEYLNQRDIDYFQCNDLHMNNRHFTPDFSIILTKGIDGIVNEAKQTLSNNTLLETQIDYLKGVIAAYEGLSTLINRYSDYALELANKETELERKNELFKISEVCKNICHSKANNFYEAIQLLWFAHLTTMIESFCFINFGRLDVLFYPFLKDTSEDMAQQLIDCLILKIYDQTDLNGTYLNKQESQINITIGGVDEKGNDAVNPVTFMILNALEKAKLPEPLLAIRINSKNPPELLKRASELSVKGLNFMSYYNDDLFIKSMVGAGLDPKNARQYAFDLCQDINIPGKGDFFTSGSVSLSHLLMKYLKEVSDDVSYEEFISGYKNLISNAIHSEISRYNETHKGMLEYSKGNHEYYFEKIKNDEIDTNLVGHSLRNPLPFLSGLYHSCVETATDLIFQNLPIKDIGFWIAASVEAINSISAIKKYVFDKKEYTLSYIYKACEENYNSFDYEILRNKLWNAPKWGNDDDYVDLIAKDILEFSCNEILKHKTVTGGRHLAGIHQPHPVPSGKFLMATPEGRKNAEPLAVTLSPESGTLKNGALKALKSASKINYEYVQWNFCVMLSYYASTFEGNAGSSIFEDLIKTYFKLGGLQHQPNIICLEDLKQAQLNPKDYKDLIVRLWGVSAHFVDLPRELQDEFISRLM